MQQDLTTPQRCPRGLLVGTYLLYLGLTSSASVPLFGGIDWLHEGERLGTVQVILSGGLPIRDVYLPHGFMPEVVRPLLAFWLFGASLASDRLAGLLLAPLPYVAAAFYLWRLFSSQFWRAVGLASFALYPLLLLPRHAMVLWTLGFLTSWARQPQRRLLMAAGFLSGLAFVFSTIEQAMFLLATVLLIPFVVSLERRGSGQAAGTRRTAFATLLEIGTPLYGALAVGMLPFLAYLVLTGTMSVFVSDLFRRAEADAFAFTHVWKHESFPHFTPGNAIWYVIPLFYVALSALIAIRIRRGDRSWTAVLPTVLFGIVSFMYAVRQFTYWKLAVVSFPFIAGVIYVLAVIEKDWAERSEIPHALRSASVPMVSGLTAALMLVLLVLALLRDWTPKQIIPQVLFPALALTVLASGAMAAWGRVRIDRRRKLALVSVAAALVLSVWFYNDAKPQIVAAQLKKPKFVSETGRLVSDWVQAGGRLSREQPQYVHDEVLAYLVAQRQKGRPVVLLASGAGVYYFYAGVAPPNRFPHVEQATAEAWAEEVIQGLDRTSAELLVSCRDPGRTVTGWPMHPRMVEYIAANYADNGRRLQSQLTGQDCPFSVWTHHERHGKPGRVREGYGLRMTEASGTAKDRYLD